MRAFTMCLPLKRIRSKLIRPFHRQKKKFEILWFGMYESSSVGARKTFYYGYWMEKNSFFFFHPLSCWFLSRAISVRLKGETAIPQSAWTICIHFDVSIFLFYWFCRICDDSSISMKTLNEKLVSLLIENKSVRYLIWRSHAASILRAIPNRAKEYKNQHRPWFVRLQPRIDWQLGVINGNWSGRGFFFFAQLKWVRASSAIGHMQTQPFKMFEFRHGRFLSSAFQLPSKWSECREITEIAIKSIAPSIEKLKIAFNWNILVENGMEF